MEMSEITIDSSERKNITNQLSKLRAEEQEYVDVVQVSTQAGIPELALHMLALEPETGITVLHLG